MGKWSNSNKSILLYCSRHHLSSFKTAISLEDVPIMFFFFLSTPMKWLLRIQHQYISSEGATTECSFASSHSFTSYHSIYIYIQDAFNRFKTFTTTMAIFCFFVIRTQKKLKILRSYDHFPSIMYLHQLRENCNYNPISQPSN